MKLVQPCSEYQVKDKMNLFRLSFLLFNATFDVLV